jgi:hypothetical protein
LVDGLTVVWAAMRGLLRCVNWLVEGEGRVLLTELTRTLRGGGFVCLREGKGGGVAISAYALA